MIGNRVIGLRTISLAALLIAVVCSYWGWLMIWQAEFYSASMNTARYLIYNEFVLIGILFGSDTSRFNSVHGPFREFVESAQRSGKQLIAGYLGMMLAIVALRDEFVSKWFLISYFPIFYLTLLFSNHILKNWLAHWIFSGNSNERVALVGSPERVLQIKPWLEKKSPLGFETVGVVCDDAPAGEATSPFPILGTTDHMAEILVQASINQLIVLDLSLGAPKLRRLTQVCESASVRLLAVDNLYGYFTHSTTSFEDDGIRLIGLRDEPLESPINRFIKRSIDVAISIPVVVLILPITTAAVWILQKLQSSGPIFFTQARRGMMGKQFRIIKYRTMVPNNENEATQAKQNDPRTYPAGRILRRLNIDELPQFINVLKGDMSVVGPRPHMIEHEEGWGKVMSRYAVRRFILPGLTGWAQVQGYRGEVCSEGDIERRVEADIHYLENWSLSLDCAIILRTFAQFFFPSKNAH